MKTLKRLACMVMVAGLVTFLWAPSGMASIYQTSDTFSTADEDLTFEYWDSSWGTLNSVTITFNMDITGNTFSLSNNTGSPATGDATFEVTAELTGVGGAPSLINSGYSYFIGSGTDQLYDSESVHYELANGESLNWGGGLHYIDATNGTAGATGQYVGTGTFQLNVDVNQIIDLEGDIIDYTIRPATGYAGGVTITYDYTGDGPPSVVPEPGTMLLLGFGLMGLAGLSRRRMGHK